MAKGKTLGPQFVRYFAPVIEALKELGGSGRPTEVADWIAVKLGISEKEQREQISTGQSRFVNQVHWARFYLAKAGYIGSSERGVWSLTEKGRNASLTHRDAYEIFQQIQRQVKQAREAEVAASGEHLIEETVEELTEESAEKLLDHRAAVLELLQDLPPSGFERFSQKLLRESGFENVKVVGKSGDGGIDGYGILAINDFVSLQVYFQCKRYSGSVGANVVREFRGAMTGRADKGIIITTGVFTTAAREEATRVLPPIELVDGVKLLDMMEKLEFGLIPRKAYDINDDFFEEFSESN